MFFQTVNLIDLKSYLILVMIFQVADVKGLGSSDTYTLKAAFDNIGSLKVRSPVKVGGVVIGRVVDGGFLITKGISIDTKQITL